MIELRSSCLAITLDPAHGAEVLELVDLHSGRQALGRPPFQAAAPRDGELDEQSWTASYRGGWQIATPNAGNSCELHGQRHGFHGRASVDPWELLHRDESSATLRWVGHGLELTRTLIAYGSTVTVELSWTATRRRVPLVAVEHICFGSALLDPAVEVVTNAWAHELSEVEGAPPARGAWTRWPQSRLLAGGTEHAGTWPLARPRARFTALTGFTRGYAEVRNRSSGFGVQIEWNHLKLPAAWLWHELRASGGPWQHRAELLAFEPASVPHSLGLTEAVARGQAFWAAPGEHDGYRLSLALL